MAQQSHRQSGPPSGLAVEHVAPSTRTRRSHQEHADSGSHEHAIVILSGHHGTNASWALFAPHRVVVLDKTDIPNIGFDATTYLWWIIRNYHALPAWCLFMHNHEYHWHHPFYSQLVSMVIDVQTLGHGYLNIAHDRGGRMQVYEKGALVELNVTENEQVPCQQARVARLRCRVPQSSAHDDRMWPPFAQPNPFFTSNLLVFAKRS